MIGRLRQLRLVPVVLFATISLFALKSVSLLVDGHYALDDSVAVDDDITGTIPGNAAPRKVGSSGASGKPAGTPGAPSEMRSWAQQMFNYPDMTGAVEGKPAPKNPALAQGAATGAVPEEPPNGAKGWKPV